MGFAFEPGDVLAFYGSGLMSWLIELATWGPSHVGIICPFGEELILVESTSLCNRPCLIRGVPVHGAQAHWPEERILDYRRNVEVYRLTRAWKLTPYECQVLSRTLEHEVEEHVTYDFSRAALSATRVVKWLKYPDPGSQFCSELCAAALMRVGRMPISNPAGYNPGGLVRTLQRTGVVERIKLRGR